MKFQSIAFFSVLITTSAMVGCGSYSIFGERQFVREMEQEQSDGMFVPGNDFQVVGGDTGKRYRAPADIMARTPMEKMASYKHQLDQVVSNEVQDLEDQLSEEDMQLYLQFCSIDPSMSEKAYFLRLADSFEKQRYVRSKGIKLKANGGQTKDLELAVKKNDIVLGMTKEQVERSWGRPNRIDVAGNPRYENERWAFYEDGTPRFIYFESGVVHGWGQ